MRRSEFKKKLMEDVRPETPCNVLCHKFMLVTCHGNDLECKEYVKFLDDTERYSVYHNNEGYET